MIPNFNVDWKESLLILVGLLMIIVIFYVFNRKSISRENELRKLLKERLAQDQQELKNLPINNQNTMEVRKATPQVIQAYERLIILMERIDLQKLVNRVQPISTLKQDYANFLIQNIDQEYEFNISQQLYVTEEAWALIATAKQTIIQQILKTSLSNDVTNAHDLQIRLTEFIDSNSVVDLAKTRLKAEFRSLV